MKLINIGGNIVKVNFECIAAKYKPLLRKEASKWVNLYNYDDLYQVALIALWNAYEVYKLPYSFGAIAKKIIRFKLLDYHTVNKKYYLRNVSFETTAFINKDGTKLTLEDKLGEECKDIEKYSDDEILRKVLNQLTKQQTEEISSIIFKDVKRRDVAAKYNLDDNFYRDKAQRTLSKVRQLYLKEVEYGQI